MFSWLFGEKKEKLFDHSLDEWNYLGRTNIMFTTNDKPTDTAIIHFFVHKNGKDRSWKMITDKYVKFETRHPYCTLSLPLWKARETSLSHLIEHPSFFLQSYMFDTHNKMWNPDKQEWSNYVETQEECNVVTVKFRGLGDKR